MKKHIRLVLWATILGGIASLWILVQAQAQSNEQGGGRIDAFTFYIPYPADILDDQFETALSDAPPDRPPSLIDNDIITLISIALDREGSVIYYDHWEDGYESNLSQPTQASTQIWGDNNPANGIPPGFTTDLLATPGTSQDDVITLRNTVALPRDPGAFFYDGGDLLTSEGGAIAVTLSFWTADPGPGPLFMDAWELYPTNRWGARYRVPVGEDLAGTGPNQRLGFDIVGLNIQAVTDNTSVQIDLDNSGDFETTVTLDQGEQFTRLGTEGPPGSNSVLAGANIRASNPVQVHIFTGNPASRYEARGYTIVPVDQLTSDYLAPRSSDGDFWLFNPGDDDLEVRVQTAITGTETIIVPADSTIKYPSVGLSAATGMRFTATDGRPFSVLAAFDENDVQDWGYALLPFNRLATQALIGLGLGNVREPPTNNQSRIYVTAVEETTIFVDYDNDGNVDAEFDVSPLSETFITDPEDNDMTGAFLFTSDETPFATVWGQDQDADGALPSLDAGTGIVPLPSLLLQKTFRVAEDADCTGSVTVADAVEFKLQYFSQTINTIHNVVITDNLPASVAYIPNSTQLNGAPIPDNSGGTPFPLDEGGLNVGDIGSMGTGLLTFRVTVNDTGVPIINQAIISSEELPQGSDLVVIFTATDARNPLYQIEQTIIDPADGFVSSGQTVTISLSIANTGSETITEFSLQDSFDPTHLAFQGAVPPPETTAPGQIDWTDLTNTFGDLSPGAVANLTVNLVVLENLPPDLTETSLQAVGSGGRLSDGTILPVCSDVAVLNIKPAQIPTPSPTLTAIPTSTATPKPPDTPPTPPPPSTPAGTPIAVNIPAPTSTVFPVNLLPETGQRETPGTWGMGWSWLFFGAVIAVICWFWRSSQLRN
ncbi:MAG: IgGFc-binding protein [Anaerolineales bacterium]|nr:IgGFc-binding protein [Anaerolineales bacterium]